MSTASIPLPADHSMGVIRNVRIFLTEARYEFVRLLRTRAFSMSVVGFPVVFYIFFGLIMNRGQMIHGVAVAKYMLPLTRYLAWWARPSSELASACPANSMPAGSS